jgi:O-methyltransferase involved in polyketide biosynthesis
MEGLSMYLHPEDVYTLLSRLAGCGAGDVLAGRVFHPDGPQGRPAAQPAPDRRV